MPRHAIIKQKKVKRFVSLFHYFVTLNCGMRIEFCKFNDERWTVGRSIVRGAFVHRNIHRTFVKSRICPRQEVRLDPFIVETFLNVETSIVEKCRKCCGPTHV